MSPTDTIPPPPDGADITAADIFRPSSRPAVAAVKAARQVLKGEAPDDELTDTDAALVSAFALAYADRLQFDYLENAWRVYQTGIWRRATSGEAIREFQSFVETRAFERIAAAASSRDLDAVRRATRRELSASAIRRNVELAQSQALLANDGAGWNADRAALATLDGQLVNLTTSTARPATPADRLTISTAVPLDLAAPADRWRRFVLEIADGDAERAELIRLALGYSITGDLSEQVFFVLLGAGANGKSTLLETVAAVLGDYAGLLPFSALTRDRDSRAVQAEIAQLPGVRFVRASELREGAYLDEGRIKGITGGDPVSAAHKFGRPFVFRPSFKLWLGVNHRPRVSDRSHGFWRRAVLIPFTRTFAVDKTLDRQLRDEAPGILAWLIKAAVDWRRHGLNRPTTVEAAGQEWRASEDLIGQWAALAIEPDPIGRLGAADAYAAFCRWADSEHVSDRERPGRRTFGEWLSERFERASGKSGRYYRVRLVEGEGSGGRSGNLPYARAGGELSQTPVTPVTRHPEVTREDY